MSTVRSGALTRLNGKLEWREHICGNSYSSEPYVDTPNLGPLSKRLRFGPIYGHGDPVWHVHQYVSMYVAMWS